MGRGQRRWLAGDAFPRRGFAGVEQFSATGTYSGRGLAVEHHHGMSNPLAGSNRRCGAGNRLLDSEGGSAAMDLTGARVYAKLGLGFG